MGRKPGRATYEDLLKLPDHVVGEIIDGELIVTPRPAIPHAVAGSSLGSDLVSFFQRGRGGPGGCWILDEPELHFGADVIVPDMAGWRRDRMPSPPNAPAIELPPDRAEPVDAVELDMSAWWTPLPRPSDEEVDARGRRAGTDDHR